MHRSFLVLAILFAFTFTLAAQNTNWQVNSYTLAGGQLLKADFNNDGAPDLFNASGSSSVLLNDGHGSFSAPIFNGISMYLPATIAVTDFDSDGTNDIVNCHQVYDQQSGTSTYSLELWHGVGDGTFTLSQSIPISGCAELAVTDVNHDGHPDIVLTQTAGNSGAPPVYNNQISVYLGNGTGFGAPVATTGISLDDGSGNSCQVQGSMAPGDFNGDGHADLLIPTNCYNQTTTYGTIELFQGDGPGHFTHTRVYGDANNYDLTTEDINQDGRLDAAVLTSGSGPHASFWNKYGQFLNNGDGTFTMNFNYSVSSYAQDYDNVIDSGLFGDFTGDGIKDIVIGYADGADCCTPPTPHLSLFPATTEGQYASPQPISSNPGRSMVRGDFDRDGKLDFAVATQNGIDVYLNRTASAPACAAPASLRAVSLCTGAGKTGLRVQANTTDNRIVQAMKIYVDGVSSFWTPDDMINRVLPLSAGTHKITAKAWDELGAFSTSQSVTVGGSSTCNNTTDRTVMICSPTSGITVTSPVHVVASIADSATVSAVKVYVDGTVVYTTTSKNIDQSFPMSAGSHRITVRAWDASGYFSQSIVVNVSGSSSTCTAPTTQGAINICSPAAGSTVSSPVHISAAINDANSSYSGAKAYVDGTSVYSTTSKSIDTNVSLAAGTHKLTIKYWEGSTSFYKSETFTVQ